MISGYHEQVARHYEEFPYPAYPLFASGLWKQLQSVDLSSWGIEGPCRDVWIAGCGTIGPLMFGRRNPTVAFLATDLSRRSLRQLKTRLWLHGIHNVRTAYEDLMESHYRDAFDAIDCYGVLHHTFSPGLGLQRLARALRSGGVLRLMVYSRHARATIEELRQKVGEEKLRKVSEVRNFLKRMGVKPFGDLSNSSGVADALLNPIVHTYDEAAFLQLLASEASLQLLDLNSKGNFVAFLKKT